MISKRLIVTARVCRSPQSSISKMSGNLSIQIQWNPIKKIEYMKTEDSVDDKEEFIAAHPTLVARR